MTDKQCSVAERVPESINEQRKSRLQVSVEVTKSDLGILDKQLREAQRSLSVIERKIINTKRTLGVYRELLSKCKS